MFLFVDLLQDELTKEEDSVRDVVYLCLAGLKQVCILYVYFKSNIEACFSNINHKLFCTYFVIEESV